LLRVHRVALDRYFSEGGLRLAREEVETTTGIVLPYEPIWINSDTLAERFDSGTIKRSTLVVTVKTKKDADAILAKGLSFGGRRHEVERFWMKGEGAICMNCYGPDHFGKCAEAARCFICAGDHEGGKHKCEVAGCNKKSGLCEHCVAKCTNCGGSHMATSLRCPEKRQAQSRNKNKNIAGIQSSPPRQSDAITNQEPKDQGLADRELGDGEPIDEEPIDDNTSELSSGDTIVVRQPSWNSMDLDTESEFDALLTPTPKTRTLVSPVNDSTTA
jgi:hypothetical protein